MWKRGNIEGIVRLGARPIIAKSNVIPALMHLDYYTMHSRYFHTREFYTIMTCLACVTQHTDDSASQRAICYTRYCMIQALGICHLVGCHLWIYIMNGLQLCFNFKSRLAKPINSQCDTPGVILHDHTLCKQLVSTLPLTSVKATRTSLTRP